MISGQVLKNLMGKPIKRLSGKVAKIGDDEECPECCGPDICAEAGSTINLTLAGIDAAACPGVTLSVDGTYTLTYYDAISDEFNSYYTAAGGTWDDGNNSGYCTFFVAIDCGGHFDGSSDLIDAVIIETEPTVNTVFYNDDDNPTRSYGDPVPQDLDFYGGCGGGMLSDGGTATVTIP